MEPILQLQSTEPVVADKILRNAKNTFALQKQVSYLYIQSLQITYTYTVSYFEVSSTLKRESRFNPDQSQVTNISILHKYTFINQ